MVIIMAVITHEYYYYRITVLTCEIYLASLARGPAGLGSTQLGLQADENARHSNPCRSHGFIDLVGVYFNTFHWLG